MYVLAFSLVAFHAVVRSVFFRRLLLVFYRIKIAALGDYSDFLMAIPTIVNLPVLQVQVCSIV